MQQTPDRAKLGRNTPVRRLITGLWQMADEERDGKPFDLDAAAEALRDYARLRNQAQVGETYAEVAK